jgi:hypothetical protein
MEIVKYESCIRCGQIQERLATNAGYIKHDIGDCIGALVQRIDDLNNRVDELETKESAREFSEHGPKW